MFTDRDGAFVKMASGTHQGLVRLRNEDWTYTNAELGVAIVADGMGGLQAGQIASRTAVETAVDAIERVGAADVADLATVFSETHDAVQAKARGLGLLGKMGTTLAVWRATPAGCLCGHVGDSRIYRYAAGALHQLTKDQTLAQRLIDLGMTEPDDEINERNSHVLTQAIGLPGDFEPEVLDDVPHGSRFLLCSDGLSDLVANERIADLLAIENLEDCCAELVKAALDRGGRDNVSVVVVEV